MKGQRVRKISSVPSSEQCGFVSAGIALVLNRLNSLQLSPTIGGPDLEAAHTYSQWQGCMKDSYMLNQLLCLPLPEPELARYVYLPVALYPTAHYHRITDWCARSLGSWGSSSIPRLYVFSSSILDMGMIITLS